MESSVNSRQAKGVVVAGEIAVTPHQLRAISAKMKSGAKEVEEILSRLSNHVAPVRSEWTGPAQAYFNAFWDQSLHDANDLRSILVGMATLTETAATAYEATERRIAESFGEFRNSPNTVFADSDNDAKNATENGTQLIDSAGVESATGLLQEEPENEAVAALEELDQGDETLRGSISSSEIATDDGFASVETTEIEDGSIDFDDQSTAPSKANGRLPWARFITKSSRSEAGDADVGGKVPERRFKTSDPALKPGTRLCRLCFTVVSLEPDLIEKTATHDYVRCPHCGNSFPVRHEDVAGQELSQ
jgi:WXG100 family type VII secretion target